ncbi:hypothetical protein EHN06_13020 [Marinobacter sp. NP-4(2019)]|uniref:hypothetical protein n=1 Tax=Marinobacter sp. NP-4(2019) TaxID=2488665 RepID=UPI000FC3F2B2|nr:hypothetical protein [Marinobacter sp. NP-4(2019)]AZT84383.1 hypothetical protein EHN06_13020 [Marinobacter sp. NP-4(2019)]
MIRDSIKNRFESVQAAGKRFEDQLRPQLDKASAELKKVLANMGADVSEPRSLSEVVSQIRSKNPTFRELTLRLDVATYDLRKKLWWDANMMTAYFTDKAGKTYEAEVKPKLTEARSRAESEARRLIEQVRELAPGRNARNQEDTSGKE